MDEIFEIRSAKQKLRAAMRRQMRSRKVVDDPSRQIFAQVAKMREWRDAQSVLWYVNLPGEVQTQPFLEKELAGGRRCAVSWCEPDRLQLAWLESMSELSARTLGILEPIREIRDDANRRLDVGEIDLVLVPGLAFDRQGHRLGHGKGYYDRLLSRARSDTTRVGLAFEEQVCEAVPWEPHDVIMDYVVTEAAVYQITPTQK